MLLDPQEKRVLQERLVMRVRLVTLDPQEKRVLQVMLALLVRLEMRGLLVTLGPQVLLVTLDL